MSVYRPQKSPFYHYDFWRSGHRFYGSTRQTALRAAEAVEKEKKRQADVAVAALKDGEAQLKGRAPLTLDVAAGRWWVEKGQFRADADSCWKSLEDMLEHFGKDRRMDAITDPDVAGWVAVERGKTVWGKTKLRDGRPAPLRSNATVNRVTVDAMRRIYGRARKGWKLAYANEPDWAEHRLPEAEERVRELAGNEQEAVTEAARPDYERVYRFARLSGLRQKTCLIPKAAVKFDLGRIEIHGKGKKLNRVPLSEPLIALILECWDDHPTMLFTYAAKVTRDGRVAGKRYPITVAGLKTQWKIDRKRAAEIAPTIRDYRFHDNRHTAATRILRSTGNLKMVQKLLNHSRITTSAKYAHVLDDELLDAMNAQPDRDEKSRTKSRTAATKVSDVRKRRA